LRRTLTISGAQSSDAYADENLAGCLFLEMYHTETPQEMKSPLSLLTASNTGCRKLIGLSQGLAVRAWNRKPVVQLPLIVSSIRDN